MANGVGRLPDDSSSTTLSNRSGFIWSGGDCHIYSNHCEQVETQLLRTPKTLPELIIRRKADSIFDYQYEDFEFKDYLYDEPIRAPVAV